MDLCNVCQGFDIRSLLLASASQTTEATNQLSLTNVDANDLRPPLPRFYKHHNSTVALKQSAEKDCNLCKLLWLTCLKTLGKADVTEDWLDRTFPGPLYLGCSGWTESREGFPYVTLSHDPKSDESRPLCSFEAFAERDSLPQDGRNLLGRAVYPDSSSPGCVTVASDWLHECLHEHKECGSVRDGNPLPTRVIDVGNDHQHPKLITTHGKPGTWFALSYCWGGDSEFIFNDGRKKALESGIPVHEFPPTLRDAVLITRQMGVQYIWIDALCIKQDSAEDWAIEGAKMKEVYSGAVLTLIASNSPSTHSGIFSSREVGLRGMVEWKHPSQTGDSRINVYLRPGNELWDHSLRSSPLTSRGWTLQEGLLAPRTLSYGKQQMIWECSRYQTDEGGRTTKATEDYRSKQFLQRLIQIGEQGETTRSQPSFLERLGLRQSKQEEWWKPFSIANPYDKWYDISEEFTTRSLTKDFDVLPALSGIARAFQHVLNDTYCGGLWKKDILCSLLWQRSARYEPGKGTQFDLTKRSTYLAPSWSWASMPGRMVVSSLNWKNREALQRRSTTAARILSVHTVPAGPDPFGQVSGGELVLRARYCKLDYVPPINLTYGQTAATTPELDTKSVFHRLMHNSMHVVDNIAYELYQKHEGCAEQEFGVLELVHWMEAPASRVPGMDFLFVESTGRREDEFRRLGYCTLRKEPVPIRDEVTEEMYRWIVDENEAYEELMRERWGKRTITLV